MCAGAQRVLAAACDRFAIEEKHERKPAYILRDRSWWGMGMVGNRPWQAHAYYDLVEAEARAKPDLTICEIGFNAGHSAIVFLEAAGRNATMVSFDFSFANGTGFLPYTGTGIRMVRRLFPGQLRFLSSLGLTLPIIPCRCAASSRASSASWRATRS